MNGELKRPYEDDDDDDDEGIDLSWPDDVAGRAYFILACPLMFLLAYTIPNCKKRRNLWPLVFVESILYIGFFSYFMVWWATTVGGGRGDGWHLGRGGDGVHVSHRGTSVPDLLVAIVAIIDRREAGSRVRHGGELVHRRQHLRHHFRSALTLDECSGAWLTDWTITRVNSAATYIARVLADAPHHRAMLVAIVAIARLDRAAGDGR